GTSAGLHAEPAGAANALRRRGRVNSPTRPGGKVVFAGTNQSFPRMNKLLGREEIAYGLDRRLVVRSYYSGRGQPADQVPPPLFPGFAKHVKQYRYDPAQSRALLRKAGLKLPVKVDFWYPTDVFPSYMPDPTP